MSLTIKFDNLGILIIFVQNYIRRKENSFKFPYIKVIIVYREEIILLYHFFCMIIIAIKFK